MVAAGGLALREVAALPLMRVAALEGPSFSFFVLLGLPYMLP